MPVRERKEIQELLRAQRIEFCIWQALFGRSITQLPKTIFAERRSVSKSTNTWTASSPRWRARRLDTTDLPGISVRKLRQQLRGKRCEVFSSDVKVRIRKDAADFYLSGCHGGLLRRRECRSLRGRGARDLRGLIARHGADRPSRKAAQLPVLSSLDVYALVDQFHIAVTVYRRTDEGWKIEFFTEKEDVLMLPSVECSLAMNRDLTSARICCARTAREIDELLRANGVAAAQHSLGSRC